ncbi:unnamed protein product [Mytilus coruscus]|uniref:Ig-like domain-containing protein n=1 Tax=Mytilus coruscus TaxID=42192 RepID=A0A6J8A6J1_MYTCO|nr:unnamed protein product [Mytilus coruscus]
MTDFEIVGIPLQSNGSLIRGNQTLIIPAATSVNNVYYLCRVDTGKRHATSDKVFVRVIGEASAPVMSTTLKIEGVVGHPVGFLNITTYCSLVKEEIQIKCYVQAVPALNYFSWIHDKILLALNGGLINGNQTLVIPVATSVNNGQYSCSAENAKTSATSDPVYVHIIGGLPVISTNGQTRVVVHQSDSVTLHCDINSKPAALFVYWTKQVNGIESVIDAGGGNLHTFHMFLECIKPSTCFLGPEACNMNDTIPKECPITTTGNSTTTVEPTTTPEITTPQESTKTTKSQCSKKNHNHNST